MSDLEKPVLQPTQHRGLALQQGLLLLLSIALLLTLALLLLPSAWLPEEVQRLRATEATEAADTSLRLVDQSLVLTVGADGDYLSLNAALGVASGMRHRFTGTDAGIEIRILPGTVLNEQVHLYSMDLSHIRLSGPEPVTVDISGFEHADDDRDSVPFINAQRGSRTPLIDVLFEQAPVPASEDTAANEHGAVGLLLNRGSSAVITPNGGFTGYRDGATVYNGSTLSARFGTLQGTRWGLHARHMSDANLRSATITGGEIGVWARRASRIDVRAANLSGTGGVGILADNVSLVEAHGAQLHSRDVAAHAFRGGQINLLEADLEGSVLGAQVSDGGFIFAHQLSKLEGVETLFSVMPNAFSRDGVIFSDVDQD